ncbi:unnamed protein product [Orchesella dallaii]|uniref:Sodium-dependent neutral amino acid transporter B(0)AT3 n=1 Tax=Orchesella dallaii TaxID=48710 RepID=A0ABP1QFI1_9HEXA
MSFRDPLPWKNCASATTDPAEEAYCNENFPGRSSKYYWFKKTLDVSYGISEPGHYNWYLALYLLMAWSIIWLILWKGTKSVGMVVYFTAVFPYVVLGIFFIFNFFNHPAKGWLGAYRLLLPKWDYLLNPQTWLKAGSQIFFSLGLAYGVLVIFASYNPARNDCHKDAVLISLINCGTSVFAALVVFPIIGVLGYTNYESCIAEMKPIFPGQSMLTAANEHDIYFTTKAVKLSDISPSVPLYIRYGYGELSTDSSEWYFKEALDNKRTNEVIVQITNPAEIHYPPSLPLLDGLRDCSIGNEATKSGGGTGFVFVGFTEAVLHMPCPQLWSFLFFFMLLTLGIDSGFGTVEGSVAAVQDLTNLTRFQATTIVCIILSILAILLFPFGWGVYVLDLLDQWTANWTFLGIAFAECIAVGWLYGLAKIAYDVRLMTGKKPNLFILICWKYVSPLIIIVLLGASVVQYIIDGVTKGLLYNPFKDGAEVYVPMPAYAITVGFLLMLFCIMWIPIHIALRKTRFNIIPPDEGPAEFPEDELRDERKINVDREEDQFSTTEKALMGRASIHDLQEHRDKSTTSIPKRESLP